MLSVRRVVSPWEKEKAGIAWRLEWGEQLWRGGKAARGM
jgi:hypothetical protein